MKSKGKFSTGNNTGSTYDASGSATPPKKSNTPKGKAYVDTSMNPTNGMSVRIQK